MPTRVVSTPHPRRPAYWLVAASVAAIGYFTLAPAPGEPSTAFFCFVCGSRGGVDAVLNVLLFMPLGVALSLCGVRWPRAVLATLLLSACIEATQFVAIPGRDATIGDIGTNTLGGSLGVALVHWRHAWLRPSNRFAVFACGAWSALWLAMQAIVSFALAPSLPNDPYYGQLARAFVSMATFEGRILDARVGAVAIPDRVIPESSNIRSLLAANAAVSAVVVPARETPRLAPIVRIADRARNEIVILGQDRRSAVFGLRTGAAILRLRPPLFRLPDALRVVAGGSSPSPDDTVRLVARYGRNVELSAERSGVITARSVPVVAGLGWTLVLPEQRYIEGSALETTMTSLWYLAWLVPLGFWLGWLRGSARRAFSILRLAGLTLPVGAVLAFGLTILPIRSGLAAASLEHWLSAIAGIIAGLVIAQWLRRRPIAQ